MARPVTAPALRFWPKVVRDPESECWIWIGETHKRDHHGRFYDGAARVMAYRWSYTTLVGPIPDGLSLDHLCREPQCVNPAHLDPVPHHVNYHRGIAFGAVNARKTNCPAGHPLNGENLQMNSGKRTCRTCRNRQARIYQSRKREASRAA